MKTPQHILWINEASAFVGGAERYMAETSRALRDGGMLTSLLYSVTTDTDARFLEAFDRSFPLVEPGRQARALAPDVIYVHRMRDNAVLEELMATGIPVVRFFHDHQPFCLREHKYTTLTATTCTRPIGVHCYGCLGFLNKGKSGKGIALTTVADLRRHHRAHDGFAGIVVGSEYMAGHVADHGFAPETIHVLPLFPSTWPAPDGSVKREPGHGLFVGQLARGKGLDLALHALAQTPGHIRLTVAGDGPQREEWETLARGLGLGSRVRFLGKVGRDELHHLYQEVGFTVVPSRSPETLSLVGLESLSHGTPVVATLVGGMGEWLRHEETGLAVHPGDIDDLAGAMTRLSFDPVLAQHMGEQGRRLQQSRFTLESHMEALLGLFSDLRLRRAA